MQYATKKKADYEQKNGIEKTPKKDKKRENLRRIDNTATA